MAHHGERRVALLKTKPGATPHNYSAEITKLGFDYEIPLCQDIQLRPFPASYEIPLYESNFRVALSGNSELSLNAPMDMFLYQAKIHNLLINTETLKLLSNLAKFSNETYITASREWKSLLSKLIPLCMKKKKNKNNKKNKSDDDDPLQNIKQTSLTFTELEIRILPIVCLSHYRNEDNAVTASVCVTIGASSMLLSPLSDADRDASARRNISGNSSPTYSSRSASPASRSSRSMSPPSRARGRVGNETMSVEGVSSIDENGPDDAEEVDDEEAQSGDEDEDEEGEEGEDAEEGEEDDENDDVDAEVIDEKVINEVEETTKRIDETPADPARSDDTDAPSASPAAKSTLRIVVPESHDATVSEMPNNFTVKVPGASLIKNLQEERRITMRNILRWTIQLFSTVHSLHMKFTTLHGDVCLEDVMLLSDPMMMSSMKECHSKYLKDTGKVIRLQGVSRQEAVDEEMKELLLVRRFSKERDAWIDPSRWLSSKTLPFRGYSNPLITRFYQNKSSIIYADKKNIGVFSVPTKLEAERKQLLFDLKLFHHSVCKDLRSLGFILVQMLLKEHILPWDGLRTKLLSESCSYEDVINLLPMQLLYKECPELVSILQLCYNTEAKYLPCEVQTKTKSFNTQVLVEILPVCDNILLTLKEVQAKKEKNLHWKKRSKWSRKDERERIKKIQDRKQELKDKADKAVDIALMRIAEQQELKHFYLQPLHVQKKLLAKKEARIKAEANRKARIRYLHQAAWYRWGQVEAEGWLDKAISALLLNALDMKEGPKGKFHEADIYDPAIHSRKGNPKETIKFIEMALTPLQPPYLQQILKAYNYKSYMAINSKKGAAVGDVWHDYELLIKLISKLAAHGISMSCENKVLGAILDTAQEQVYVKVEGSTILSMLPPDQLKAKMVQMEADYLLKSVAGGAIRGVYKEIEKKCEIPESTDFTRRMAYMTAVAILEKFKSCAGMREVGEAVAASLLAAIYRQNKVRRMIKAVWIRAQSEYQKQLLEEQEARRLRILAGNPLPEDLLESAEFVTDTGVKQKFETLDPPVYLSVESTDSTQITVEVGITLASTRYGPGSKEENHNVTAHGLLLRTPLKLPDATSDVEATEISLVVPTNPLTTTATAASSPSNSSSSNKRHMVVGSGITDDEAGEVVVLLRDHRQVSQYSEELLHWYHQACLKGSISFITGGESRVTDEQVAPTNNHYPRICNESIHVSVDYIGKQPITEKWSRETFAKKKELEARGEEYTTNIDRFQITIHSVLPYTKYRVAVLLSDIFKPVQKWDRDLNYRYDYNNPPKYFPITNQVAFVLPTVMTVGNASEPPEFKSIEVTYSDHSLEYRETQLQESNEEVKGDRSTLDNGIVTEMKIEVGVSTDLRAVDAFCRLDWMKPYNNGSWIHSYEVQRQVVVVVMNNNNTQALGAKEYTYLKNMPVDIVYKRMKKMQDALPGGAAKVPAAVKRIGIDPISGINISTWKKCKTVKISSAYSDVLQYTDVVHFPEDICSLINEYYNYLYMTKHAPFAFNPASGDDLAAVYVNYRVRAVNMHGKSPFNKDFFMHRLGIIRLFKVKQKSATVTTHSIDTAQVVENSRLITINTSAAGAGNQMISPSLYGLVQSSVRLNQLQGSDTSSLDVMLSVEQRKRLDRLTNTIGGGGGRGKVGTVKPPRSASSADQVKRRGGDSSESLGGDSISSTTTEYLLHSPSAPLASPVTMFMPSNESMSVTSTGTTPSRLWDGKKVLQPTQQTVDPIVAIPADLLVRIPTEQLCADDKPTNKKAWWKRSDEVEKEVEDSNVSNWLARLSFVSPMNMKKA